MADQNPPRRPSHDSPDWVDRLAASIRDLNPDYHDFEAEVAKMIRAALPAEAAPTPTAEEMWKRTTQPLGAAEGPAEAPPPDPPHVREDYRDVWLSGWRAGQATKEQL